MKKKTAVYTVAVSTIITVSVLAAGAGRKPLQSNIGKGVYIHNDLITKENIKSLPIPLTLEDYSFYQSIGKVSNVVMGRFKKGLKKVTLVTDRDADGKVDLICTWMVDNNTVDVEPKPGEAISPEKFKEMKSDIVNGKRDELSPNPEGINYLKVLLKTPSTIIRMRNGYRVAMKDPDAMFIERVSYYYSDNGVHGVDMAFEVKYQHVGHVRMQPLIPIWVYCKDSYDPFAVDLVKTLIMETRNHKFEK